jgi:predicted O-methyltransferase YrrM
MRQRTTAAKILRRLRNYAARGTESLERRYRRRELADASLPADIRTHMTALELRSLYDLAGEAKNVLEIGSYLGASSAHLAAALSLHGGRLVCVDTWANETMPEGTRDTLAEFQRNTAGVANAIAIVRKRSEELTAGDVTLPLDLVFIDGDHDYAAVRGDVEKVRGWIRDGGTLAFHDAFFFEGVSRVVGEVLATGEWQLAGKVDNLVWLTKIRAFPHPMERSS